MSEATKIDRPIEGEITRYSTRYKVEQGTAAEFLDELDRVLAIPGVEEVRWSQYTPYFNDGEPCVFGSGDIYYKFTGSDDEGDYGDGFVDSWSVNYQDADGVFPYRSDKVDPASYEALRAEGLGLSRYQDVLQDNFGDPAQVTATKAGFNVEYYEHE